MVTAPDRNDIAHVVTAELRVWDLATGQELLATPLPVVQPFGPPGWSPFDGRQLRVFGGMQGDWSTHVLDGKPR
jgi:hypothetical protein